MTKAKLKIAYGERYGEQFILRPIKSRPFMTIVPCGLFDSKEAAETKALQLGYKIEWNF